MSRTAHNPTRYVPILPASAINNLTVGFVMGTDASMQIAQVPFVLVLTLGDFHQGRPEPTRPDGIERRFIAMTYHMPKTALYRTQQEALDAISSFIKPCALHTALAEHRRVRAEEAERTERMFSQCPI